MRHCKVVWASGLLLTFKFKKKKDKHDQLLRAKKFDAFSQRLLFGHGVRLQGRPIEGLEDMWRRARLWHWRKNCSPTLQSTVASPNQFILSQSSSCGGKKGLWLLVQGPCRPSSLAILTRPESQDSSSNNATRPTQWSSAFFSCISIKAIILSNKQLLFDSSCLTLETAWRQRWAAK
jgi:hypothetical protein